MGIEAVQEPVGVRLNSPAPPAVRWQREQSMAWVDFPGHADIELGPSYIQGSPHNPLQRRALEGSSEAASQDALNG